MRNEVLSRRAWAAFAALLFASAGVALAGSIAVPNGTGGGTCGAGNANNYRFGGNCGALVTVDSATPVYVQDNSPAAETTYRVRGYVDLKGRTAIIPPTASNDVLLTMADGDEFDVFVAYDGADPVPPATTGNPIVRVEIQRASGQYQVVVAVRLDGGTESVTSAKLLRQGWRSIELNWARATAPGANNGTLAWWVDGTAQTGLSGLDNDTTVINYVRWGAVGGVDSPSTSGTFKLDDFVSQRTDYVGPAQPFSDNVNTADPFWKFVQSAWANEIMPGCTISTFCPANNITREQMAKYIVVAKLGSDFNPPACTSPLFADVPCSSHYAPYINLLASSGVVAGCGGGNYCPLGNVTRQEMVVFILAAFPTTGIACTDPYIFTDVPFSSSFCPWIERARVSGLTGGCTPTTFCPTQNVPKNQMATFLVQTYQPTAIHNVGP